MFMVSKTVLGLFTAGAIAFCFTSAAMADAKASIEARQACMKANGAMMKVMVPVIKGQSAYDKAANDAAIAAVEQARSDGYAIVREEFEAGLVAAAAPVLAPDGHVIAAINVSAPAFRFSDRLDEAATHVQIAARLVANRLADPAAGTRRTTR